MAGNLVVSEWSEVDGAFLVSQATERGLGKIRGATRKSFEAALLRKFPDGVTVRYPEGEQLLPATQNFRHS